MEDICTCCRKKHIRIPIGCFTFRFLRLYMFALPKTQVKIYVVKRATGISRTDGLNIFPDVCSRY